MVYVPFYFKDYRHDTRGLDALTHGVYLLLLFEFLEKRRPLPGDVGVLYELAEARTGKDRKAVESVLKRFWVRLLDGWIQKRAFVQITDYENGRVVKVANGGAQRGVTKPVIDMDLAKRAVMRALANCRRSGSDPLSDHYEMTSDSLAALINHESVIKNQKTRIKNQPPVAAGERSAEDWANVLHALFSGRRDAPMECLEAIAQDIATGQVTGPELEGLVREIVGYIEGRAPGGWKNAFIGTGRNFWLQRKWRNPEAFAQRWDDPKKNKGAVVAGDDGSAPPVIPLCDEPDGWRVVWPDHFDFTPPERWLDVPLSDRRMLMSEALMWQKKQAETGAA